MRKIIYIYTYTHFFFNDQVKACLGIKKSQSLTGKANSWPTTSVPSSPFLDVLPCLLHGRFDSPWDRGGGSRSRRASLVLSFSFESVSLSGKILHVVSAGLQVNDGIENKSVRHRKADHLSPGQSVIEQFLLPSNIFHLHAQHSPSRVNFSLTFLPIIVGVRS